jgi:hypothetical protein
MCMCACCDIDIGSRVSGWSGAARRGRHRLGPCNGAPAHESFIKRLQVHTELKGHRGNPSFQS